MHLVRRHALTRTLAGLVALAGLGLAPLGGAETTAVAATTSTHVVGADVSWPECPPTMGIAGKRGEGKPMPAPTSDFVVLGLTNGPAFFRNPCLEREVAWAKRHHVYAAAYAVTTYPFPRHLRRYGSHGPYRPSTLLGRLRNVGYNQARFNIRTMADAGLRSPVVWVDVEHSSLKVWPRGIRRNQAVVTGLLRGYRDAGRRVGVYSTSSLWRQILGNAHYGLPEWRTAGQTSRSSALSRCSGAGFQGGRAVLSQWWTSAKDLDVMCPGFGRPKAMHRWFHKY
jgi:hypothetical protein